MWCYIFDYFPGAIYECFIPDTVENVYDYLQNEYNLNMDNIFYMVSQNQLQIEKLEKP